MVYFKTISRYRGKVITSVIRTDKGIRSLKNSAKRKGANIKVQRITGQTATRLAMKNIGSAHGVRGVKGYVLSIRKRR